MDTAGLPTRLKARLQRGRAMAEARMGAVNGGSSAVVKRFAGFEPPDEKGHEAESWVVIHSGPMRLAGVRGGASPSRTETPPGGEVQVAQRIAHFPAGTETFEDGDVIEIVAGESAGSAWRVIEAARADQQTAYRVPVTAHP
ncbi:DUF6093 family protein [Microbacterium sp.]|uniref:DUF6093 family protein n=1 Tax=Microbacterium sp. TaxID=51671 RepID=UPI003734D775